MKPIIGCEMYVAYGSRFDKAGVEDGQADAGANNHLIVLAANNEGYKNLVKLVSAGYTEGFYYKPRIDKELLREHREGLIVLSSCLKGEVSQSLAGGNLTKAKEAALQYKDILGADNFFLEIQDHGIPDQQKIVPMMAKLGEEDRPSPRGHQRLALPLEGRRLRARSPALHRHRARRSATRSG